MSITIHLRGQNDAVWCGAGYNADAITFVPENCNCRHCLDAVMRFGSRASKRLRQLGGVK